MNQSQFARAAALYASWLHELSRLLTFYRPKPDGWSTLLLNTANGLSIYIADEKTPVPVLKSASGASTQEAAGLTKELVAEVKKHSRRIVLRLSPNDIVDRTIQIPTAASDVIEPVLQNQLERIVPWSTDDTRYGFRILGANAAAPDQLDIHVVATKHNAIERALRRCEELGLSPHAVDFASEPMAASGIALHSLEVDPLKRTARMLHIVLMALLVVSIGTGSFGLYSLVDRISQNDDLESKIAVAKSREAEINQLNNENLRLKQQRAYLFKRKTDEPAAVLLLEALSSTLPDNAYLTELEFHGREARLVGKAEDPTALITKLEDSSNFEDVRFSAPTTRQEGESAGTFSIVSHIESRASQDDKP